MDQNRITDIQYISEFVHNFLDIGNLSLSLHKQFWLNLNNPETSTCYFTVLITKLIGIDTGDKNSTLTELIKKFLIENGASIETPYMNPKSLTEEQLNMIALKNSILNTLYFLALYYRFNPEYPFLKIALNKWSQITLTERGKVDISERSKVDFCDEVIKMISQASLESSDVMRIVDLCSNIDTVPGHDFSNERIDARLTVSSLLNNYLRGLLYKETNCKIILEATLLFLKHPLLSEKRMLSLVHLLKNFVLLAPKVPQEVIASALSIVKNYYLWPLPYGDVARDVLQLLTVELKAPGTAMRKRMTEENPELIKGNPKTGKERTVHILYDIFSMNARTLHELMKTHVTPDVTIQQLQVNLLANMLSTALNCDTNVLGLEFLLKEDVARFYETAVQVLSEAVLMSQQDAESFRINSLSALLEEIAAAVEISSKIQSSTIKPRPPVLPPLNFEFVPVNVDNSHPPPDDFNPSQTKNKYPKRTSFDVLATIIGKYAPFSDIKNKPVVKIGVVGGDAMIHNIVCSYIHLRTTAPKSFDGLDIQFFMIPVEQSYFASFLSKYDGWYSRHVVCMLKCVLKSLPCVSLSSLSSSGTISGLNASSPYNNIINGNRDRDSSKEGDKAKSWNSTDLSSNISDQLKNMNLNNVKLGTGSQTTRIRPSYNSESLSRTDSASFFQDLKKIYEEDDKPPTPSIVLRNELQNYFREAKWKLDVNVYQCDCWGADGNLITFPFFQKAEIGLRAYARSVQKQNDLAESTPLSVVQQHKQFKFSPPNLSIKYIQMNVVGIPKQGNPIENKSFISICLSNIPMQGDRGVPPNPTKQWLETTLIEVDKKKKSKTDKELETFPVTSLHTSSIEIDSDDKKKDKNFHILLDNILYGPFTKVKISAAKPHDEILTFPIMTFFPLDLPS